MTRQTHARPPAGGRAVHRAPPAGGRGPDGSEPLLVLQRQIGNAGVGALLGRVAVQRSGSRASVDSDEFFDARSELSYTSDGSSYDSDEFFDAEEELADPDLDGGTGPAGATTLADVVEVARRSLENQPEVSIDPAQLLAALSVRPGPEEVTGPEPIAEESTTPPGSPHNRRPASLSSEPAELTGDAEGAPPPSRFRRVVDGDEAKMVGAGLATAGPFTGLANNASPSLALMAGATGGASLTAAGDAVSELLKGHRSPTGYDVVNWPKVIGGILAFGGLTAAAAGTGLGVPGLRAGGMLSQSAGLLIKSAGEGWKFERGSTPWSGLPDSDISKAVGAFVAAVAPALAAGAFISEPELAKMLTSDALSSGTTGSRLLKAALWFAAGSGAGDFASEVVKGVHDGKVNPAKMWGGFLQLSGAFTFAGGALWRNLDARNAGLALQAAGLASKSVGEGRKLEDSALGAWPGRLTKKKSQGSPV